MEFLKAFAVAKKLGMTKEEFLPIWELEFRSRQLIESNVAVPRKTISSNQSALSDSQGSTKFPQQLQQVKDELLKDLHTQAQTLCDQVIKKQELQWNQLLQTYEQLSREFLNHFEILCKHTTNTVETSGSSLKLFFMQEINLLEQSLKKVIEDKTTIYESSCMHCSDIKTAGHLHRQLDKGVKCADSRNHKIAVDEIHQNVQTEPDIDLGTVCGKFDNHEETTLKSKYTAALNNSSHKGTSALLSSKSSFGGTGLCSKVIYVQTKNKTSLSGLTHSSSLHKENESDSYMDEKEVAKVNPEVAKVNSKELDRSASDDSTINHETGQKECSRTLIPTHYTTFTITSSDTFASSHQDYMTSFYYTKSKACRVRFRLHFNANHQLNIFLLISNGQYDDKGKWPISFTSDGYIYNETSETCTPLWSLGPRKCNKPDTGREIALKVNVNLQTLRNSTPDVTYKTICDKGYALHNQLSFDWKITADES